MNKDLPKYNEPFISAEDGWRQMQQLLDENIPLHTGLIQRIALTQFLVASSILILLMLISVQLNKNTAILIFANNAKNTSNKIDSKNTSIISHSASNKTTAQDLVFSNVTAGLKERKNPFLKTDGNALINSDSSAVNTLTVQSIEDEDNIADETAINKTDSFAEHTPSANTATFIKSKKGPQKKTWTLSAGVAANLPTTGNTISVRPSPVVELKYNFSPRFYFSTGISPYTFVNNTTAALSKTVYLNDTVNNISMDKETTLYDHFHYLDVPVSFSVNVTKRIALKAGLQVSFLLNKKEKKLLEGYDFLMNRLTVPATTVMSLVPNTTAEYDVKVKNIDYRFLAGIRYNLNKASLGLTYQGGLTPLLTKNSNNSSKNNLVSLDLLFKIK